ncbi:DNA-binding MarR family transcriptional regulator [Bradyrhizobium macuxiense]|uniref:DNA-binding MarR family transcriptional regulator n=1 Tax=Bradyrhizobium macuxiense TaxID=1755647 RepID=A0A560LNG6_9BRAD|nr:MarR family winged helix-turn-helix transcriptional regulator [Bradyrhizobium macuxiense]TWB95994.1 DNA-binding MarR family transcriptional regulator [Bradyrhizobium macuxiense]
MNEDETKLWLRLLGCSSQIAREINRRLRDRFEYSLARLHVLEALSASKRGMALNHLANALMVPQSNVTALVNELVKIGHIKRVTAEADRRVQVVLLTKAGRAILRRLRAEQTRALSALFLDVPRDDIASLLMDLTGFEQAVSANVQLNGKRRTAPRRRRQPPPKSPRRRPASQSRSKQ